MYMKASKQYFREYYAKRRAEYINMLGGKCIACNTVVLLEFDHIDSATKSFAIGKLMSVSKQKALEEIKKCQLLCKPCHIIKTKESGESGGGWNRGRLTHGSNGYKQDCRCEVCMIWNHARNIKRRVSVIESSHSGLVQRT